MPAETAPLHYAGRVLHCRDGVLGLKRHAGLRIQLTHAPSCWNVHKLQNVVHSSVPSVKYRFRFTGLGTMQKKTQDKNFFSTLGHTMQRTYYQSKPNKNIDNGKQQATVHHMLE